MDIKNKILINLKKVFKKNKKRISQKIPNEILLEILTYVDILTLNTMKYVCKFTYYEINKIIENNKIFGDINLKILEIFDNDKDYINIINKYNVINIEYKQDLEDAPDGYSKDYMITLFDKYYKINNILYVFSSSIIISKIKEFDEDEENDFVFYVNIYRINDKKTIYNNTEFELEVYHLCLTYCCHDYNLKFNDILKLYLFIILNLNDNIFFYIYNKSDKNIKVNNFIMEITKSNYIIINNDFYVYPKKENENKLWFDKEKIDKLLFLRSFFVYYHFPTEISIEILNILNNKNKKFIK